MEITNAEPRLKLAVVRSGVTALSLLLTAKLLLTSSLVTVTPLAPLTVTDAWVLRLVAPEDRTEDRPAASLNSLEPEVFEVPNVAVTAVPLPSLKVSVSPTDKAVMPDELRVAVAWVDAVRPLALKADVAVTCVVSEAIAAVPVSALSA